jgi:steroid delta-isomerase-like uncharacterized protein
VTATTELVRRYYDAFNAKDFDGMLACVADDIRHDVNEGGRRGGKAAFREFLKSMDRCYDERLEDIVVMVDQTGRRAAAEFVVHGRYLVADPGLPEARGQAYVLPVGAFLEVTDGKIARVTTYYNLKNWIAQVSKAA